jgi:hypothetical protein
LVVGVVVKQLLVAGAEVVVVPEVFVLLLVML